MNFEGLKGSKIPQLKISLLFCKPLWLKKPICGMVSFMLLKVSEMDPKIWRK